MIRITTIFLTLLLSTMAFSADNSWLTSKLYGNDNQYAALKKVTITQVDGKHKLHIKNQFNFTCDLSLDSVGQPAELANCVSPPEPVCEINKPNSICAQQTGCFQSLPETKGKCFQNWQVKESKIELKCKRTKKEDVCKGRYTLVSGEYDSASELVIAKRYK